MLYVLQYLAIIAAFALPFLIGGIVRFAKTRERRKLTLCIVILAFAAASLTLSLVISFGASAA